MRNAKELLVLYFYSLFVHTHNVIITMSLLSLLSFFVLQSFKIPTSLHTHHPPLTHLQFRRRPQSRCRGAHVRSCCPQLGRSRPRRTTRPVDTRRKLGGIASFKPPPSEKKTMTSPASRRVKKLRGLLPLQRTKQGDVPPEHALLEAVQILG